MTAPGDGSPAAASDPYDQLPYDDFAWQPSHPDQLAVVAHLRGLTPPDVASARILEIGCANGGNLLPMAAALPDAQLLGFDRSGVQIETARAHARELGSSNLTFAQTDLEDAAAMAALAETHGPFDYIIAHGLWGWVSAAARAAVLGLIGRTLAPQGVAYLSTDMLPGGRLRQMSRDLLVFHDKPDRALDWRLDQARAILRVVSEAAPEGSLHGVLLRAEAQKAARPTPSFLFHDRLAADYHPVLLSDLVAQAGAHGLRYLGDARPTEMVPDRLPDELAAALDAGDAPLEMRLQYQDFVTRQTFRRVLFTRAGGPPLRWPLPADRLEGLHARADVEVAGVTGDEVTGVEAECFQALEAAWPGSLPLDALGGDAPRRARVRAVLRAAWLAGTATLSTRPTAAAGTLGALPCAPRYARWQARRGETLVVNALHALVRVEALHRVLLGACDGSRDALALLGVAVAAAEAGDLDVERNGAPVTRPLELARAPADPVERALADLVRTGLLLREGAPGG